MIMIVLRDILSPIIEEANIKNEPSSGFKDNKPKTIRQIGKINNRSYSKCPPRAFTSPMAGLCLALIVLVSYLSVASMGLVVLAEEGGDPQTEEPANHQHRNGRHQHQRSDRTHYQPSLIGFRCETTRDVTSNGVSVIEANSPVTLTLYGESFSTNTIVAFTNEFKPDLDEQRAWLDLSNSPLERDQLPATNGNTTESSGKSATDGTIELGQAPTGRPFVSSDMSSIERAPKRKFTERRRLQSGSYDCTDYNRVTSYKLTEKNILSPNVVTLTVTLPELDAGAGMYYYFCIKQPKLTPDSGPAATNKSQAETIPLTSSSSSSSSSSLSDELVWVHQGVQWWVTLKVEPPILSVTNDIVLMVFLLFLSAVTSGLNLGLMSLDMNELAVISSCGDHKERSYARTIAPLRKRGNYLLCSLLLGNVMVNSTLTVILEELTSGLIAVIGSTLAIVILGEIVPQAFCARQGLAIGAKTIYLTYAFMILTFPLSWPISCLLDCVLGEEKGNVYDRERLMEFIRITGHHTQLESDEVAIISGALKLKKIKVDQIMTRIEDVFMLPIDCKLDRDTIKRIIEKGYSRIPVYEYGDRKQIVALILAKDLALIDPDDHTPIASMLMYCKHPLIFIENDTPLDVALNEFKTGKSHMAVVRQIYDDGETDKYYEAIGVVTLEDVIEEVLQVEINDETDTLSDNRRKRRRTDAQVAHLIDELTQTSSSAGTGVVMSNPIGNKVFQSVSGSAAAAAAGGYAKDGSNQLVSQLTEVSISGLAQSLGQVNNNNSSRATPMASPATLSQLPSPHELSYSPSVMSQYHSIELSTSSSSPSVKQQATRRDPARAGSAGNSDDLQAQPQSPVDRGAEAASLMSRASQFISQLMS